MRSPRSTDCATLPSSLRSPQAGVLVTTVGARGTLWIAGGVSALAALAGVVALARRGEAPVAAVD